VLDELLPVACHVVEQYADNPMPTREIGSRQPFTELALTI
jgi:hypothetical protein